MTINSLQKIPARHTLGDRHVFLPLLFGLLFMLGCLLHYQKGYFNSSPNYFHASGSDDAYISYRYGWNLAHYNNLSWNESGFRKTEGFTNPLWVMLSAAWSLANDKDLVYPGVTFTSVLVTTILLVVMAHRIQRKTTTNFALTGLFLVSVSPIVWSHTTSGMEAGVFGALIGLIAYIFIFERNKRIMNWGGILIVFSILLRSDGFIYIFILVFALGVSLSPSWKQSITALLVGLIVLVSWRLFTFGALVPNTAIAKLNFSLWERSIIGIQLLLFSLLGILPLFLVGLQGILRLEKKEKLASFLVVSGWFAYYVYMGGDTYLERHIIGVLFFLACLASFQFDSLRSSWKHKYSIALVLVLLLFFPIFMGDARFEYWKHKPADPWILFGKEMSNNREEYGVTIVSPAGKIPFYAGGDFVDELGLNDPYLAHLKRKIFIPGHAAGNREAAIEIARYKANVVSCFVFGKEVVPADLERITIWIDNIHPEQGVQHTISEDDIKVVQKSHPLGYTFLLMIQR